MNVETAYNFLKSKEIYPEEIWDYIVYEESDSQWFYDALLDINSCYDILSDDQNPEDLSVEELVDEILDYFAYDQELVLEELLKFAPSDKLLDDFILLAARYEIELEV